MKKQGPKLEMYSEARIAFERELRDNHPLTMIKILLASSETGDEIDEGIVIGCVAAEFGIIMDGMYSKDQIEHLYDMLFHKLRERRGEVILPKEAKIIVPPGTTAH